MLVNICRSDFLARGKSGGAARGLQAGFFVGTRWDAGALLQKEIAEERVVGGKSRLNGKYLRRISRPSDLGRLPAIGDSSGLLVG